MAIETKTREDFLKERAGGIGGTDAGILMGVNPYKTAYRLWQDKVFGEPETAPNRFMHFGQVLEDVVAREFASVTGYSVTAEDLYIKDPAADYIRGHVDRWIAGADGERIGVLECKTAGAWSAEQFAKYPCYWAEGQTPAETSGPEDMPPAYYFQVQHYLMISGLKTGFLAVLIGGNDFRVYRIEADPALHEKMRETYAEFWEHVTTRTPPEDAERYLDPGTPQAGEKVLTHEESGAAALLCIEYRRLDEQIKAAEAQKELIKKRLVLEYVKDAEVVKDADGLKMFSLKGRNVKQFNAERAEAEDPAAFAQYTYIINKYTESRPGAKTFRMIFK